MKTKAKSMTAAALIVGASLLSPQPSSSQTNPDRLVRIAELEIDPAQLEAYKQALRKEITTSLQLEPGVLTLYAVSIKGHPDQIRLFEIYASPAAYQSHLQSEHFRKYKTITAAMIKSLRLIETKPVLLGTK